MTCSRSLRRAHRPPPRQSWCNMGEIFAHAGDALLGMNAEGYLPPRTVPASHHPAGEALHPPGAGRSCPGRCGNCPPRYVRWYPHSCRGRLAWPPARPSGRPDATLNFPGFPGICTAVNNCRAPGCHCLVFLFVKRGPFWPCPGAGCVHGCSNCVCVCTHTHTPHTHTHTHTHTTPVCAARFCSRARPKRSWFNKKKRRKGYRLQTGAPAVVHRGANSGNPGKLRVGRSGRPLRTAGGSEPRLHE